MEQFVVVGSGSNFVLLKTVLLSSGLATKSKPSQTFFLINFHMASQWQMILHMAAPTPFPSLWSPKGMQAPAF